MKELTLALLMWISSNTSLVYAHQPKRLMSNRHKPLFFVFTQNFLGLAVDARYDLHDLSSGPENLRIINHTVDYFLYGTFDPWDLVAISMGALTAYLIIEKTKRREPCYEACTRAGLFLYAQPPLPTAHRCRTRATSAA